MSLGDTRGRGGVFDRRRGRRKSVKVIECCAVLVTYAV